MTDEAEATAPADVDSVPDNALRTALEFAVAVAAHGQKIRPPLASPAALKPYLRSTRLDASGLRAVRRAVTADDDFMRRLSLAEPSQLVDELGRAWLRRADGWQGEVRRLLTGNRERAADVSAAAALRKAEKRREAAEQVATRSQTELIAHRDALARESTRREQAEARALASAAESESLRADLVGLQREVERLRSRLDAESGRVVAEEARTAGLRDELAEVQRVRDGLLTTRHEASTGADVAAAAAAAAQPTASSLPTASPPMASAVGAPPGGAASEAAARALRQAAAATRELAAALAAAGDALAEPSPTVEAIPGIKPLRPRHHRRQPIPIPGGVYGDSVAAAEHLLRTPGVVVVIDGYNVAKLAWPQSELIDQRERCIALLEDVARRVGADIRVVFDGAGVVGASARRRVIRVQYSPPGVSADDVIRADVGALPSRQSVVVVTNDQAIIVDMRGAGVNVVASDNLLAVAGRPLS